MGDPLRTASDGIDVAYATYGDGPRDVLLIHGFTTHLDDRTEQPLRSGLRDRGHRPRHRGPAGVPGAWDLYTVTA